MTANQSRLGVDIRASPTGTLRITSKLEMDFYNPVNQADNKPAPMLRHAYVKFEYPELDLTITAGQTWDLVSPLNPNTLNYVVNWTAGNIGYRRPQIRVSKGLKFGDDSKLLLEAALTRTVSDSGLFGAASDEDSSLPGFQAHLSYSRKVFEAKPAALGLSGSWSQARSFSSVTSSGAPTSSTDYNVFTQWSLGVDASLPLPWGFSLGGEYYRGQDLKGLLGISTVTSYNGAAEQENGGWAQVSFAPSETWAFDLGYSRTDITDLGDLATGALSANSAYYVNALYHLAPTAIVGLEYSHWFSQYQSAADGIDDRLQLSIQYGF